jgi:hypothetical protein
VGAQEPPARRSARLVAVAAQRAGPSYALPGQAASTVSRGTQKQDWVRIKSAYQPKVGQNSTGVDNPPFGVSRKSGLLSTWSRYGSINQPFTGFGFT